MKIFIAAASAMLVLTGTPSFAAGLAVETLPIAHQRPVVAIRKDSAKQIASLEDLLAPGISIAVADPEQAAVGKAVRNLLEKIESNGTNRWRWPWTRRCATAGKTIGGAIRSRSSR